MSRHLYIAEVDRWSDYIGDSLRVESALTYQIDTAEFNVRGSQPNEGDEVILEDDSLGRLFGGVIVKVDLADTMPGRSVNVWKVDCDDYTGKLDRRLVVETYTDMTADAIFRDIVAKYCSEFTTNGVRTGAPTVDSLIFDYVPVSEAFKQLCDYVGWQWQPDYYKDLSFFNSNDLTSEAPMSISPGGYFRNLKHTIDQQGLRNRVYVKGGTMLSDPFTYEVVADGAARTWPLPHKPHDVSLIVGGVAKTVGIENVHKEEDFDYLMSYEEKYVRASAQTATPADGLLMSFTYKYDIDVITTVEDLDSQASIAAVQGGDGVYEYVISDDSLVSLDAAEAAGLADLRDHANPQIKGSFETEYDVKSAMYYWSGGTNRTWNTLSANTWGNLSIVKKWQPGQLVNIDLPDRGIVGTFLVQKVTITSATPDKWTYKVEYGGRLLGIADFLKALVSAQQKKKANDSALLHKFKYGEEKSLVTDELVTTFHGLSWKCGDADAICGFVACG